MSGFLKMVCSFTLYYSPPYQLRRTVIN